MGNLGRVVSINRGANDAPSGPWTANLELPSRNAFEAEIIGESLSLKKVLKQVETVAPTGSTVIIQGETGTGKELIARAIHNLSSRRDRAFVSTNCASIPAGLLESELFGHERGAYTGAVARGIGRFAFAAMSGVRPRGLLRFIEEQTRAKALSSDATLDHQVV